MFGTSRIRFTNLLMRHTYTLMLTASTVYAKHVNLFAPKIMNLTDLNRNKWTSLVAYIVLFYNIGIILSLFIIFNRYSTYPQVTDSLKHVSLELDAPYFTGGIVVTIGIACMVVFKGLKSNIALIAVGLITLVLYYSKLHIGI